MKSPFKFLDSYNKDDREIFFGRDMEIEELYQRVFDSKLLLVYGVSGTGKSSLIHCGLANKFLETDWLPLVIRRGGNIIDSMAAGIKSSSITQQLARFKNPKDFKKGVRSLYLDYYKPVFFIFDQFEELFIFGDKEERKEFILIIKALIESDLQCRLIFVMREEYMAGVTEFEKYIPTFFSNRVRIEKMLHANALEAIKEPCKVFNIRLEDSFAESLLEKLCLGSADVELTYLQVFLDKVFHLSQHENELLNEQQDLVFTLTLLKSVDVSDLLGSFLDDQISLLDDPDTGLAVLKSFVSVQGTKRQMNELETIDSVKSFGTVIMEPDILKYLLKFVDLRILRDKDETGHFELRHDALAAKIFEKFTLIEKELLEVRLFVENAYQAFNTRKTYLTRDDLDYLSTYEKRLFLPSTLNHFISQSKDKLLVQQRQLNRLTRLVAVIFLVLIGLGVRYYFTQKGTSKTRDLITLALLQEKVDPLTSINSAFRIKERDTTTAVVPGIIMSSFYTLLQEKLVNGDTSVPGDLIPLQIPVQDSICSMRMNKSGTLLYGWTTGYEIFSWNMKDSLVRTFKVSGPILTIEMSDNSKNLAVIYSNNTGEVFTSGGNIRFPFKTSSNHLMNERLVRFFHGEKYFMAAVNGNKVQIYDTLGTCLYNLEGHSGSINSLDISPDGRFVATASSDKLAIIWNFNHNTNKFSPYDTITGHRDTIWSCEFNKTGKYVLTASADSMLKISYLDGRPRDINFWYATNSSGGINLNHAGNHKFFVKDSGAYIDIYMKRICNARFAANDSAIIALNYSYDKMKGKNQEEFFRMPVIYFGRSMNNNDLRIDPFFIKAKHSKILIQPHPYQSWEISNDRQQFAAVSHNNRNIILTAVNGYQLLEFPGNFPYFSKDGKSLFYLYENKIRMLPLSLSQIYFLVFEKKLFGDPGKGEEPWKLL